MNRLIKLGFSVCMVAAMAACNTETPPVSASANSEVEQTPTLTENQTPDPTVVQTPDPTVVQTPDPTVVQTPDPTVVQAPEPTPTPTIDTWFNDFYRCTDRSITWPDVTDWFYQLQWVDYEALANTRYDLVVIDGEPPERPPNRNVIERLKCDGDGEKLVVSYMTIGQAENYRYYWQPDWEVGNPSWIYTPDVFWEGDFYVRYWVQEWRDILMGSVDSRIDRLVEAGFDGLYLDIIDAYELFLDENPNAREDMRLLIADIAAYAREKSGNPDFGIFVQNAEELIEVIGPTWIEPLTGIGKEEPFFWAMDDRVSEESRFWNNHYLSQWVAAGKLVINVDYVIEPANIDEAYDLSYQNGYIPLAIHDKLLNELIVNPGHEPD